MTGATRRNSGEHPPAPHSGTTWEDRVGAVAETKDKTAFVALFNHFAPRIKAFLIKQGETPEEAEEIAQEALIRLWNRASQFDRSKAMVSTWLFTIARNSRIDRMRKRQRLEPDPTDPAFTNNEQQSPDEIVGARQEAKIVHAALQKMPPEMLKAVELSFFHDMSHSGIAEQLGLPLGTVKSRIRRGLELLRSRYEEGNS